MCRSVRRAAKSKERRYERKGPIDVVRLFVAVHCHIRCAIHRCLHQSNQIERNACEAWYARRKQHFGATQYTDERQQRDIRCSWNAHIPAKAAEPRSQVGLHTRHLPADAILLRRQFPAKLPNRNNRRWIDFQGVLLLYIYYNNISLFLLCVMFYFFFYYKKYMVLRVCQWCCWRLSGEYSARSSVSASAQCIRREWNSAVSLLAIVHSLVS